MKKIKKVNKLLFYFKFAVYKIFTYHVIASAVLPIVWQTQMRSGINLIPLYVVCPGVRCFRRDMAVDKRRHIHASIRDDKVKLDGATMRQCDGRQMKPIHFRDA